MVDFEKLIRQYEEVLNETFNEVKIEEGIDVQTRILELALKEIKERDGRKAIEKQLSQLRLAAKGEIVAEKGVSSSEIKNNKLINNYENLKKELGEMKLPTAASCGVSN